MSRVLRLLESLCGVHTHRAAPVALPEPKSAPHRTAKIVHADGWAVPFVLPDDTPRTQLVDDEIAKQWNNAYERSRLACRCAFGVET